MRLRTVCLLSSAVWLGCAGLPEDGELVSSAEPELEQAAADTGEAGIEIIDKVPSLDDYPGIAEACHGDVTCSGVTSCTNWSSGYDCDGGDCRITPRCCEPFVKGEPEASLICEGEPGFGFFQNREQFRVCFYSDGSQCLEFNQFSGAFLFCGC